MVLSQRALLAARALADSGAWIWTYLTAPVALFASGSLAWLLLSKRRVGGFLVSWVVLFLLPGAMVAAVFFPRYVLPLIVPLLVASALAVGAIAVRSPPAAAGVLLALLVWPARDLSLQAADWKRQTLVPIDRWQFVSGWPAGAATERALERLGAEARRGPVAVITSPRSGNPTDTFWLYGPAKGLSLYAAGSFDEELLPAGPERGTYRLRGDLRLRQESRAIRLPDATRVFLVTTEELLTADGPRAAADLLRPRNPGVRLFARYENPGGTAKDPAAAIVIFRLR
jgi:hypothetical protein